MKKCVEDMKEYVGSMRKCAGNTKKYVKICELYEEICGSGTQKSRAPNEVRCESSYIGFSLDKCIGLSKISSFPLIQALGLGKIPSCISCIGSGGASRRIQLFLCINTLELGKIPTLLPYKLWDLGKFRASSPVRPRTQQSEVQVVINSLLPALCTASESWKNSELSPCIGPEAQKNFERSLDTPLGRHETIYIFFFFAWLRNLFTGD